MRRYVIRNVIGPIVSQSNIDVNTPETLANTQRWSYWMAIVATDYSFSGMNLSSSCLFVRGEVQLATFYLALMCVLV